MKLNVTGLSNTVSIDKNLDMSTVSYHNTPQDRKEYIFKFKLVPSSDSILKTPCQKIDFANPPFDIIEYSKDLVRFMYEKNGIGISSNQVGYPYAIFAIRGSPQNFVMINPTIVDVSTEQVTLDEGCLSYPKLIVKVKRPKHIKIRFSMPNGEVRTEKYTGMTARVIQHEMCHINGKVFWDGVSRYHFERGVKKSKLSVPFNG